jgi:uncharacterized protein YyaL (SSP411 family)
VSDRATASAPRNRLADATSPYLLQHAGNPVDWHPWGEEALALARREDRPILLSVGYSACHWCHVMAHESFEDPEVAAVMNALFVNIKVDREERPDLDQIYQAAHALIARRSGGWPLTMFLTPSGVPFYGGTYFPPRGRYGLPGFGDLLPRIAAAYREQGEAIAAQGVQVIEALASLDPEPAADGVALDPTVAARAAERAIAELRRVFDDEHGGFGSAPKFPHPTQLALCLRRHALAGDGDALRMAAVTLRHMADGGIHDQLGGGFCRYSTDRAWTIPHFEKMLYDNGPLLGLYADIARITGEAAFAQAAEGIVRWLVRELRAPDGALYSSLDADSEGEEGKFYVWTAAEVRAALTADDYAAAALRYGLEGAPNFEAHAWNLRIAMSVEDVAARLGVAPADASARLVRAASALFEARATRVRPGQDDKVLTSWNALAIAGLARAARALDRPDWVDLAIDCTDALRRTAWCDGRLLATRKGERAALNAYLDDYAFLLAALLELMPARFRAADFEWALQLADVLLAQFEDRVHGGFFFTSHDHERLIHRPKPGPDNATPSGNGVAAQALIVLGHLAGEPRYIEAGERAVRLYTAAIANAPSGHATLLAALETMATPPGTVILTGDAAVCAQWRRALERTYRPALAIIDVAGVGEVPAALMKGATDPARATAWVCRGMHCLPPIGDLDALERAL